MAVSAFIKDAKVYKKEYCGYVELRHPVFQKAQSYSGGEFKVLTLAGQNGISYSPQMHSTITLRKPDNNSKYKLISSFWMLFRIEQAKQSSIVYSFL